MNKILKEYNDFTKILDQDVSEHIKIIYKSHEDLMLKMAQEIENLQERLDFVDNHCIVSIKADRR